MSRVTELKNEFIKGIKNILKENEISDFNWANIDNSMNTILQEDEENEENTCYLEYLREDGIDGYKRADGGTWFSWNYEKISLEKLEEIYEKLSKFNFKRKIKMTIVFDAYCISESVYRLRDAIDNCKLDFGQIVDVADVDNGGHYKVIKITEEN